MAYALQTSGRAEGPDLHVDATTFRIASMMSVGRVNAPQWEHWASAEDGVSGVMAMGLWHAGHV